MFHVEILEDFQPAFGSLASAVDQLNAVITAKEKAARAA